MINDVIQKAIEEIGNDEVVQKCFNEIKEFLSSKLSEVSVRVAERTKNNISDNFEDELEQRFLITIATMRKGCDQIFDNMINMVETGDFIKKLYEALSFQHNMEDESLH